MLGHELGSGRYVLERQPDLVIFHGGGGRADGVFPGEKQMQARPEFGEQYTLAHFITQGPRRYEARIWMRRHSEKIGILSSADRIDIPAYFLNADPGTAAYLDNAGRFVVPISSPQPAGIREVVLSPGRWRVEAAATSALRIDLRPTDAAAGTVTRLSANEFEITGSGKLRVDLMLEPVGPSQVEVHGLRLTRAGA